MWSFPQFLMKDQLQAPALSLTDRVISAAKSIVGQMEKPGNSGFTDTLFEQRIKDTGWKKGEAWCAYTGEEIWKQAFTIDHPLYPELSELFSGSAVKTFENFSKSTEFETGDAPRPGALAIWRYGKSWQGHLAVVIEILEAPEFKTVEGNTNAKGGREGIEVAIKTRKTGLPFAAKGLNLLGFVYLPA